MICNQKNQIIVDILNAKKLEEQIFTLINVATEEYDTFLEKQNDFLLQKMKTSELMEESYVNSFNNLSSSQIEKPFLSSMEKSMLSKQVSWSTRIYELRDISNRIVGFFRLVENLVYYIDIVPKKLINYGKFFLSSTAKNLSFIGNKHHPGTF